METTQWSWNWKHSVKPSRAEIWFSPTNQCVMLCNNLRYISLCHDMSGKRLKSCKCSPGKTVATCPTLPLPRMARDWNTRRGKGDDWHYCCCAEAAAAVWKPSHSCTLQVRNISWKLCQYSYFFHPHMLFVLSKSGLLILQIIIVFLFVQ